MALRAVFFDVGETLVDEERYWRETARAASVGPHVLWSALGVTIERGEEHSELWRHLGLERPKAWDAALYVREDIYPDAVGCLEAVRAMGLVTALAGNQNALLEQWARDERLPADLVLSSASIGARKPQRAFFDHLVAAVGFRPDEVAYVGDRVDNDVVPAAGAGLVAVHVRRGPWGRLQATPPEAALAVDDLASLPEALASLA